MGSIFTENILCNFVFTLYSIKYFVFHRCCSYLSQSIFVAKEPQGQFLLGGVHELRMDGGLPPGSQKGILF